MRKCDVCGKNKAVYEVYGTNKKICDDCKGNFLSVLDAEPYTSKTTMKMVTIMDFAEENALIKDKNEELIKR